MRTSVIQVLASAMLVVWLFLGACLIFWAVGNESWFGIVVGACICALSVAVYKVFVSIK